MGIRSTFVADALPKEVLDSAVKPSQIARQKFDVERRGFDQAQVRAYLISVADSLRDAQDREAEMRTRLGKAIRRAERAESSLRDRAPEDPSALTRQVGDEVAGVLDAARVAGEQKIAAAEKSAAQLMANAKTEATAIRRAAETVMDDRSAEANAVADELLAKTRTEADQLVTVARKDADTLRQDAASDIARARDEGDALIREAEEARLQILQDMDRRRRQARAQVERLRVGRDRLLRSYDVVRRTLDESTTELKGSLHEAKVLGDTAARRVAGESSASPHALEAEMADARMVGRGAAPAKKKGLQTPKGAAAKTAPAAGAGAKGAVSRDAAITNEAPKDIPKPTPRDGTPTGQAAKSGAAAGGAAKAATTPAVPEIQIPHVDMRTGGLSGDVAPTPRRPVVQDTSVPKPPATAPMIKAPVGEAAEPGATEDQDDEQTSAVATLIAAPDVTADDAGTDEASAEEVATTEIDSAEAGAHDAAAEIATDESGLTAEDFKDLPVEELSIIEASDEIEQVIALVPEVVELADTEVLTWVPADVAEPGRSKRSDKKPESKKAESKKAEPKKAESKKAESKKSEPKKSEPKAAANKGEPEAAPATGLFAALRKQADPETEPGTITDEAAEKAAAKAAAKVAKEAAAQAKADQQAAADAEREVEAAAAQQAADEHTASLEAATDMARQRDAIVDELSTDIEKRLKRALADEQNDVLAGIRSAGRNPVELISLVGETDDHVLRYVVAINEVAATAYAAGAALVDGEAAPGEMPAGAVEELLGSAVVLPMRLRLLELDSMETESAAAHLDAIRAFYRQRKTDHLGEAANNLAGLLVTAGACDVLPTDQPIPWLAASI